MTFKRHSVGLSSFSPLPSHSRLSSAFRRVRSTTLCLQQAKRSVAQPQSCWTAEHTGRACEFAGGWWQLPWSLGQQHYLRSLQQNMLSCEHQEFGHFQVFPAVCGKSHPTSVVYSGTLSISSCWSLVDVTQDHDVVTRIHSIHPIPQGWIAEFLRVVF